VRIDLISSAPLESACIHLTGYAEYRTIQKRGADALIMVWTPWRISATLSSGVMYPPVLKLVVAIYGVPLIVGDVALKRHVSPATVW
jgi:hypothetical protein